MADPTVLTQPEATRCPSCAATLRPDAPWCTLCYADLRPAPAPTPTPAPAQAPAPTQPSASTPAQAMAPALAPPPPVARLAPIPAAYAALDLDPLTAPLDALTGRPAPVASWPCATCGAANDLTHSACAVCGAGFLAGLREAEGPLLELPVVGDLGALSRAQRLGLAAGVVLAVIALVALLGVLFS